MVKRYRTTPPPVSAILLALLLSAAGAHPIDETFLRYEVQALALTDRLRIDLYVLHGGLVADEVWRRHDPDGDFELTPADRQAWGDALVEQLVIQVGGERRAARTDLVVVPDYQAFITCAEPIVIRAPVSGTVPRREPVECRVAVTPTLPYPVFARVSFIAPRAVRLDPLPAAPGAARARLTWPANQAIDTRLPQLTLPEWFYQLPGELPLTPIGPGAPTDEMVVRPAPSARLNRPTAAWPALLFLVAGGIAAWMGWRRSRRSRL